MDSVLQTNRLTKTYKDFHALNSLSMNIPKGSIYGIVGKNGAGKTTLIRLICGLQKPTSGDFTLYGIKSDSRDIIKSRRRMGAVVETPSIYMDMTAEENLKQQYLILGLPSYDGISELLKLVGLIDSGRMVKELSSEELENACRKCVRIEVSDTAILARVLDSFELEYKIISAQEADIFAKVHVTKLTAALLKENCEVLSMQEKDESLESYYISLVGGGKNA